MKFKIGDANNQPKDPIKEIELRVNKMFEIGDWVECSQEDFEQHFADFKNLLVLAKTYEFYLQEILNADNSFNSSTWDLADQAFKQKDKIFGSSEGDK